MRPGQTAANSFARVSPSDTLPDVRTGRIYPSGESCIESPEPMRTHAPHPLQFPFATTRAMASSSERTIVITPLWSSVRHMPRIPCQC